MPTIRAFRSLLAVSSLAAGLLGMTGTAHAQVPVLCNETALVNAINAANAAGGDTLALMPFCTYTLTSAHGSGDAGPAGLPAITTPITMAGLGTTITRDPSAPYFRILEVDGAANVPATQGQLTLAAVTISGGRATAPFPGGGITNRGGALTMVSSTVTGNSAVAGGGIYTDNGNVSLTASSVTGNTATTAGGGIYENSGMVTLLTSKVSGNTPDNCFPSGSVPGCAG